MRIMSSEEFHAETQRREERGEEVGGRGSRGGAGMQRARRGNLGEEVHAETQRARRGNLGEEIHAETRGR